MKILYVNDFWEYGGAEKIVQSLFKYAKINEHDIKFENKLPNIMNILQHTNYSTDINKKVDIVHFHNISSIGISPLKYCIDNKIPCLVTIHDYWPSCKTRELLVNEEFGTNICTNNDFKKCVGCRNQMGALPPSEHIANILNKVTLVTVSKYQADVMKRFDAYKLTDIKTIYNGIDVNAGWYSSQKEKRNEKYDYIFWFGLNKKEKNIDIFYELGKEFKDKMLFVDLATSPPGMKSLNRRTDKEIMDLYADCLFFFMTSNWAEPAGLTQMQAQASSKAVIGYNVGGIKEYLPESCGTLVERNDIGALRKVVEYLIDNPNVAKKMGEEGRKNIEHNFTESIMWDNYYKLYNEIIDIVKNNK